MKVMTEVCQCRHLAAGAGSPSVPGSPPAWLTLRPRRRPEVVGTVA